MRSIENTHMLLIKARYKHTATDIEQEHTRSREQIEISCARAGGGGACSPGTPLLAPERCHRHGRRAIHPSSMHAALVCTPDPLIVVSGSWLPDPTPPPGRLPGLLTTRPSSSAQRSTAGEKTKETAQSVSDAVFGPCRRPRELSRPAAGSGGPAGTACGAMRVSA